MKAYAVLSTLTVNFQKLFRNPKYVKKIIFSPAEAAASLFLLKSYLSSEFEELTIPK